MGERAEKMKRYFFLRLLQSRVSRAPCPLRSLEKREKNPLALQAIFVCMILAFGLSYLLIELFSIGMPVVWCGRTDGRSENGHVITKFSRLLIAVSE